MCATLTFQVPGCKQICLNVSRKGKKHYHKIFNQEHSKLSEDVNLHEQHLRLESSWSLGSEL